MVLLQVDKKCKVHIEKKAFSNLTMDGRGASVPRNTDGPGVKYVLQ